MNIHKVRALLMWVVVSTTGGDGPSQANATAENLPPVVTVVWPRPDDSLSVDVFLKIKAAATDPDGSIAQVQFFIGTNMIGVATNPPFNILWYAGMDVPIGAPWMLKAVAIDNLGARSDSAPVTIYYCILCPPMPVVEIVSPRDGDIFAAPGTFVFSAEAWPVSAMRDQSSFSQGPIPWVLLGNKSRLKAPHRQPPSP